MLLVAPHNYINRSLTLTRFNYLSLERIVSPPSHLKDQCVKLKKCYLTSIDDRQIDSDDDNIDGNLSSDDDINDPDL